MKVYIGPYKNWFGPYQLAELLCFWVKKPEVGEKKNEMVWKLGEILAHGKVLPEEKDDDVRRWDRDLPETKLYKFLQWVETKRKRKVKIRIDKYDTWSMDNTLAMIILPMLKQLRDTSHSYGLVDEEDVPENLRLYDRDHDHSGQMDLFDVEEVVREPNSDIKQVQWEWVINEMIFAFEHKVDDSWEDEFRSGEHDIMWVKEDKEYDGQKLWRMEKGPNDTYVCDYEGMKKVHDRMQNGFRLFGKYYQNLWD
jgi:hypothetical protein